MAGLDVESRRFGSKHRLRSWEFTDEETEAQTGDGTSSASTCSKGKKIMKILLVCVRGQRRAPTGPQQGLLAALVKKEGRKEKWKEGKKEGRREGGRGPVLPKPIPALAGCVLRVRYTAGSH